MSRSRSLFRRGALAAGALLALAWSATARATTTDDFMVRSTADFVALCETSPSEANYVAAVHFCQGFASGAFQYYQALALHSPTTRYVCLTDPPPTRNQAIASFLAWVRANPNVMSEPAVESMFRFLGQTYPCSDAQRAPN